MKKCRRLLVTLIIIIILFPYLKTEYLTYKYAYEFNDKGIYQGYFQELEYIKVFDYSDNIANVYFVRIDKTNGMVTELIKNKGDNWEINKILREWSTTGSADDFIFPYYP